MRFEGLFLFEASPRYSEPTRRCRARYKATRPKCPRPWSGQCRSPGTRTRGAAPVVCGTTPIGSRCCGVLSNCTNAGEDRITSTGRLPECGRSRTCTAGSPAERPAATGVDAGRPRDGRAMARGVDRGDLQHHHCKGRRARAPRRGARRVRGQPRGMAPAATVIASGSLHNLAQSWHDGVHGPRGAGEHHQGITCPSLSSTAAAATGRPRLAWSFEATGVHAPRAAASAKAS
jgi:hypothetical protein